MAYKYGVLTGLKNVYFAPLLTDDETGATYDTPIKIGDSIQVTPTFEFAEGSLSADNIVIRDDAELTGINLDINASALKLPIQSKILGHKLDANGGMLFETGDMPPEGALLYQGTLDNEKSKYVVIYKGVFRDFAETLRTKERGTKNYQTPTVTFSGYPRVDGKLRYEISEEVPNFVQSVADQWFTAVTEPVNDPWVDPRV